MSEKMKVYTSDNKGLVCTKCTKHVKKVLRIVVNPEWNLWVCYDCLLKMTGWEV